jgi:2-methylcitrate dehydratase PrpD
VPAQAFAAASRRLSGAAAGTSWLALPAAVQRQAADLFLDTLAVIAAGSVHPSYAPFVAAHAHESGPCTVLGARTAGGAPAGTAALLNGGATTVLQWQDGHRLARGHPASHLVPVLLALAEERECAADEVMAAFVAGYEVGTRVGIALGGLQPLLHDGGTWATLGAAVGAAKLLGGDATGLASALEGAASVATMPFRDTVSQGATVHHLYIGLGAAGALTVARGAHAGLQAIPGTLEAFFGPRAGADFRPAALLDGVGADDAWSRHELLQAYLKWHPVCAHFSGLAEALELVVAGAARRLGRPPQHRDVAGLEIALYATALGYDAPLPRTDLAARFSARAIAYAAFDPGGLHGDALARVATPGSEAQRWILRVQVRHDPGLDAGYPAGRPARVTLRLQDGSTGSAAVDDVYGDAARPLSDADRASKAATALARRYGTVGARAVRDAFHDWLGGAPIGRLGAALRAPRR